jgi:hypothetical protein
MLLIRIRAQIIGEMNFANIPIQRSRNTDPSYVDLALSFGHTSRKIGYGTANINKKYVIKKLIINM